jgi:Protein of unknown function (DUF4244)
MHAQLTMKRFSQASGAVCACPARLAASVQAVRSRGSDAGMATAEYAVATVAACGFGGILYRLLTSETVVKLLTDLVRRALTFAF